MSNRAYDILKFIALICAPIVTLAAALVETWGVPYGSQIVATLAALDAFLGTLVTILKHAYDKKGGDTE